MTIYNSSTGRCHSIDARETAPAAAKEDMFVNDPKQAVTGYRSIATPSELHGFWTVFNKFGSGNVPWKRLFEPSIELALFGFPVSSNLAMVLSDKEADIMEDHAMKKIFVDPRTGRVYEEGDRLKREKLGFTLSLIANSSNPVDLFYNGGLAQTIAAEIGENGGHVTLDDLKNYQTIIHEAPLEADFLPDDLSMCGPPPPSGFAVTQAIVAVMAQFYDGNSPVNLDDPEVYQRLIEAEKFAYAQRTKLGDIDFVASAKDLVRNMTTKPYIKWIASMIKNTSQPLDYYTNDKTGLVPDHGTSHVVAYDHEENAVSCTSTVNQLLGSMRVSPTLGIIWNDEMDDFSTPGVANAFGFAPSPANFIAPGKRPMSSMSPAVIYNKNTGKVRMVIGGSGGSMIISSVAQTVIRNLLFNQTVKEAVDAPRLHNQYLPYMTQYEESYPPMKCATGNSTSNERRMSSGKTVKKVRSLFGGSYLGILTLYASKMQRRAVFFASPCTYGNYRRTHEPRTEHDRRGAAEERCAGARRGGGRLHSRKQRFQTQDRHLSFRFLREVRPKLQQKTEAEVFKQPTTRSSG
ncbi:hypothetical protein L596_013446 [Steinernema carpocapsae]|nr:hypothetical protein L596_013446 [Steinernema carpocapsae]